MASMANPEVTFGEVRTQTVREMSYFCVEAQTTMAELRSTIDTSMDSLALAEVAGRVRAAGPMLFRYLGTTEPFTLQIGFPVAPGTAPVGDAQVTELAPFACASLIHGGDLGHLSEGYAALSSGMKALGLEQGDEMWEWYLYFEDDTSANNVTWLLHGIRA